VACKTVIRVGGKVVKRLSASATARDIAVVLKPIIRGGRNPSVKYECTGRDKSQSFTLMGLGLRRRNGRKKRCKFGVSKTTGKCLKRRRSRR